MVGVLVIDVLRLLDLFSSSYRRLDELLSLTELANHPSTVVLSLVALECSFYVLSFFYWYDEHILPFKWAAKIIFPCKLANIKKAPDEI